MIRIVMWGDTQTGKSTLLSAAFCGRPDLGVKGIDMAASTHAISTHLLPAWQRMANGLPVLETAQTRFAIQLVAEGGGEVVLEDVRGGITQAMNEDEHRRVLSEADGVVVLVQWRSPNQVAQFHAIDAAYELLRQRPRALVFTKCELDVEISADDERWTGPVGAWWDRVDWVTIGGGMRQRLRALFGDEIFLSSAVGYREGQGAPALLLGEFGQLIPYGPSPVNAARPLERVLAAASRRRA